MSKTDDSPTNNGAQSTRRAALGSFVGLAAGVTLPTTAIARLSQATLSPELLAAKAAWDHWDALEERDGDLECASPEYQAGEPERAAALAAYDAARDALLAKPSASWMQFEK